MPGETDPGLTRRRSMVRAHGFPLALGFAACLLMLGACQDPFGFEKMRESGKVIAADQRAGGGAVNNVISVNAYLWRAALDTVSFMPLNSGDPFGGVIITDWYSPPQTPEERFKINVYILSGSFQANSLKVALFRQTRDENGAWRDAASSQDAVHQLENKILERAYELRQASLPGE